jgi:phage-related protein
MALGGGLKGVETGTGAGAGDIVESVADGAREIRGASFDESVVQSEFYTSSCIFLPMNRDPRPLEWIGGSHRDLMALPIAVRRFFGFALSLAQAGDKHDSAKVLKGFGGAGIFEVLEDDIGGTYRAVYTVKFAETVFVLHCFQKKSKRGSVSPRCQVPPG